MTKIYFIISISDKWLFSFFLFILSFPFTVFFFPYPFCYNFAVSTCKWNACAFFFADRRNIFLLLDVSERNFFPVVGRGGGACAQSVPLCVCTFMPFQLQVSFAKKILVTCIGGQD